MGKSTKSAALTYTVPKSTLGYHVSGRVLHGTKSGSPSICPLMKKKKLVRCVLECAQMGYPKPRKDVICLVQSILGCLAGNSSKKEIGQMYLE